MFCLLADVRCTGLPPPTPNVTWPDQCRGFEGRVCIGICPVGQGRAAVSVCRRGGVWGRVENNCVEGELNFALLSYDSCTVAVEQKLQRCHCSACAAVCLQ
jgi:hypothetical protein